MPAKIRVFVSSTMEDLANERHAVVEATRHLNLEPVNAEGVLPTGGTSWDVLADEIQSSHICILIQGELYGWIPTDGYGSGQNKSVSHLEVDLAREYGIPVLPFFKRLKYGTDATSEDAVRRDKFRNELGAWSSGQFRAEFDLASDLGEKISNALLALFTRSFLRTAVEAQGPKSAPGTKVPEETTPRTHFTPRTARSGHTEVLFAGAGFSLSAGYPSANALAGALAQELGLSSDQQHRHGLAQLFDFAEQTIGRARCLEIVRELLNPPLPVEPTPAHIAAVQRFSTILTTNYDQLFEHACRMLKIDFMVRTPGDCVLDRHARSVLTIYKIDGSIERPESLVLSPSDATRAREDTLFWEAIEAVLQAAKPVVIGHSMRDATSLGLMSRRNLNIEGIYVAPAIDPIDKRLLLTKLNLRGVETLASTYLWSDPT